MAYREETMAADNVFVCGDTVEAEFWSLIMQIRSIRTSVTQAINEMPSCRNTDNSVI